jgi:uncharacterized protein (DUF58 family)
MTAADRGRSRQCYIGSVRAPENLLDQRTLERLERLAIRWQQSFRGVLGGSNVSRYAGVGHEFLDHRHFHQGDDLRSVNWRAYLRLERLFLKMFRTEPRTPVRIFLDISESMACGGTEKHGEAKFSYACRLAGALCFVGLVRLETIVIQPFGARLGESYRAQGGRHRFAVASDFISGLKTGGRSDFRNSIRQFLSMAPASGLAVILSDFLDDSDCTGSLQHLADYGQELLLVQVAGPEDRTPPWEGELELLDAESGALLRVHMDQNAAAEYTAAYDEFCEKIEYTALRNGGRYMHLTTDVAVQDALFGALMGSGAVSLQ